MQRGNESTTSKPALFLKEQAIIYKTKKQTENLFFTYSIINNNASVEVTV